MGALLAGLLGTVVLSACTGQSPIEGASPAPKDLTVAMPSISPPLTGTAQANNTLRITSNIYDPLIFLDPLTGDLTPGLATAWTQVSPTELDLTIREGVTFQDGSALSVDDVAFSLSQERLWGKDALEPSPLASTFAAVETIDDHTVRITTKQPDPALLQRLGSPIGFVVPKTIIETEGIQAFGLNPIGTGPYKLDSFSPGEKVELSANEDYWGPKPTYENVTFVEVGETSARLSGLATGEYQIATSVPPDQAPVVEANGQKTASVQVNNVVSLAFQTAHQSSPIADVRVRQAFNDAVDLATINAALWGEEVAVPDGFNLPLYGDDFYQAEHTNPGQDKKRSVKLLSAAGYDGSPIVLRYIQGVYPNFDKAIELMLADWTAVGLNVQLEPVADFTLLDLPTADIYATSSNIPLTDPVSPVWTDWVDPSSVYVAGKRGAPSAELTNAMTIVATSLELVDRQQAWADAVEAWGKDLPAIALWQPLDIYGLGDGVSLTPDPRYWMRLAPVPSA